MTFVRRMAVALGALLLGASAVQAAPVNLGTWYTFGFGDPTGAIGSGDGFILGTNPGSVAAPDAPWTFTLSNAGTLFVLDLFLSIDRFQLFDSTLGSLGLTTSPTAGGACGSNILCAIADASYSRGSFALPAGSYAITGLHTEGSGGAGVFIVSEVPIPAALPLLATAVAGAGLVGRWRKKQKTATV